MVAEHTADHDALPSELVRDVSRLSLREFHLQTIATQTLHNLAVLLVVEVGDDALRHHLTDALDFLYLLESGIHQGVDILEMACQQLGRCLSHEADAKGEDHALKGHFLRSGDAIDNTLCRLRATAVTINLLHFDFIEVGHVFDEPLTEIVIDGLRTQ